MPTMNDDAHRFADAFKNEDDLRKHLAALLNKIPHTQGVQITHGTQELGKDIVFYAPDGFGNWQLNACVVKKTKISGSVDHDDGARTVFLQAEQSLDTPFTNGRGDKERVAKVFIVSPHDCSPIAINSIQGKLDRFYGRVEFMCGSTLFDKFAQYWPEFVIFESTLLGTYVAALQQSFDQSDPISFLAHHHYIFSGADKTLRTVYVRQGFKVSLQEFEFLVEDPNLRPYDADLNKSDIDMLREQVLFLSDLLRHAQVWDDPNPEMISEIVDFLKNCSEDMVRRWRDFDTDRKERTKREREQLWRDREKNKTRSNREAIGPAKPTEELRDDAESQGRAKGFSLWLTQLPEEQAFHGALKALRAFRLKVKLASDFARKAKSENIDLHSTEYLNYLRVREIARLAPTAFRKVSPITDKPFSETLLDDEKRPLLISAPAGYGKTSFCRWNTLNDLQALLDKKSTLIPIYVPLHQLANSTVTTCETAFFRSPEVKHLVQRAKEKNTPLRIYLDGLDEVTTVEQQEKLMSLAQSLPISFPSMQVVITGRDYVGGPWLRWVSRVHLSELTDSQVSTLINNWLGEGSPEQMEFTNQLTRARTLMALMKVPLLGTLTIAVFKKLRSLPEGKVKLYEAFVELMCGGWDLAKNVRRDTKFGSHGKLGVLTRLAGLLHIGEKREAREDDIRTAVGQIMTSFSGKWRSLLDELIEDGLLIRTGPNSLTFSHLSFQEYLAATELTDPTGTRPNEIIKKFLSGENWWREVLAFYVAMSKRPDETELWIRRVTLDVGNSDARVFDLAQRFHFLMESLGSAWPAWTPKQPNLNLPKVFLNRE